jgi:2-methylcitrate dehydratase
MHNPELDRFFPESFPTRVTIAMEDGRSYSKEVRYPKGDPENPLREDEVVQKFGRAVAASGLSDARKKQIVESVFSLEKAANVRDVAALLSGC